MFSNSARSDILTGIIQSVQSGQPDLTSYHEDIMYNEEKITREYSLGYT